MTGFAAFRAGLLDPAHPVPTGLTNGAGASAGKRYDVYRNNVTHSLIAALGTAFPLVRRILGPANFDRLAPDFVRAHPPRSPLMMYYGIDFPTFLEKAPQVTHLGYLPDCARLDLAMRVAYHAADVAPFDLAAFQNLSPERMMAQQLTIAPATHVLQSRWPLFDIWRFNMTQNAPKPQMTAQDVLITRPEFDPAPHLLPIGGADWLGQLATGATLGDATEQAAAGFDLAAVLTLTLGTAAFCAKDEGQPHENA